VKKLDILCDMDSIVVDLMGPWLARYNEKFGKSVKLADVDHWDFMSTPDYYTILNEPGFFRHLPALPGALEGVEKLLSAGHNVVLVTASGPDPASDKIAWMRQYAPCFKNRMIITEAKTLKAAIGGDVLIDDGPHNMEAFKQRWPKSLVVGIEYPYNKKSYEKGHCDFMLYDCFDTERAWRHINIVVREYAENLHDRVTPSWRERHAESAA
jgi:5'-nucleotidase